MKTNPDLVAAHASEEIHNDAVEVGKMIGSEIGSMGGQHLAKQAFLELVARNWNDQRPVWGPHQNLPFRTWLRRKYGNSHFKDIFLECVTRGLLPRQPQAFALGTPQALGMPPTLAVNPQPPQLPGAVVGAMTNANG